MAFDLDISTISVQYKPLGLKKRFCLPAQTLSEILLWYRNIAHNLQALVVLALDLSVVFEADGLGGGETGGVGWLEGIDLVHGGLEGIVQLLGFGRASEKVEVAFVDTAADLGIDVLLGRDDGIGQKLALWGEVGAVVQDLGVVERDELVAESTNLTTEDRTLENTKLSECGYT